MKLGTNGYRHAHKGWSCKECRHVRIGATGHFCMNGRNGNGPAVAATHVCDLFSRSATAYPIRTKDPPRGSICAGVDFADEQYNGGAVE